MSSEPIGVALEDSSDGTVKVELNDGRRVLVESDDNIPEAHFVKMGQDGKVKKSKVDDLSVTLNHNARWHTIDSLEPHSEEENDTMQVYQAVAIKTNEDGERTEILEHDLLLAESDQKARDQFVRNLSDEYDAGSDDVELTTFL